MEIITLNNGKRVLYEYFLANSQGVAIYVKTELTKEEKKEFRSKALDDHDIVHIYF